MSVERFEEWFGRFDWCTIGFDLCIQRSGLGTAGGFGVFGCPLVLIAGFGVFVGGSGVASMGFVGSSMGIEGTDGSSASDSDLNVRVEDCDFNDFDLCELLLGINLPFLSSSLRASDSHFHPSYFAFFWFALFILVEWVDLYLPQP